MTKKNKFENTYTIICLTRYFLYSDSPMITNAWSWVSIRQNSEKKTLGENLKYVNAYMNPIYYNLSQFLKAFLFVNGRFAALQFLKKIWMKGLCLHETKPTIEKPN